MLHADNTESVCVLDSYSLQEYLKPASSFETYHYITPLHVHRTKTLEFCVSACKMICAENICNLNTCRKHNMLNNLRKQIKLYNNQKNNLNLPLQLAEGVRGSLTTSCPSLCTSLKTSLADLHLSFFNGKARLFQLKVQAYCFFKHSHKELSTACPALSC